MKSVRCYSLLLLCFCTLALAGCAVNPVTGEQQIMLLSEHDESQLGRQTDQSVIDQYGLYDDAGLQRYLQTIGQTMGRNSHRPSLDWQFKVMDSPVLNAFAAPGGYIYVTRGLLASINNEAELAGVLGHEIGHVTARHSAQQYSNKMLADLGLGLGQSLLGGYGDLLAPILETGAGLLFLKFSRDDERESDALGVEYATRAGYDSDRTADFFVTLQRQSGANGQQDTRLPEFFATHPNPLDREATVRTMARDWKTKFPGQKFNINRKAFLREIDGLVYGEDPRNGFRDGDWFYLPQFKAKLPIPKGWKFEREGNNLQMSHPQRKAVAIVGIRPGSRTNQIVSAFLKSTGAKVQKRRTVTIDGMTTRQLLSVIGDGRKRAVVVSHFYQKGSDVFAFHGLSSEGSYADMSDLMQGPATGFSAMTNQTRLNPQPKRIVVKSVARSASLEKVLRTMNVERGLWAKTAWLNGRQLSDVLMAGEQLKVIK
jgi:predicted Zn-dependent protease